MTVSPVPGVTLKTTKANNIHMRYAEAGPKNPGGPLVLFCHGWPESWYSWRHQLQAVSAAGFRCVAPDMRGYGGTEAPEPIDQYTLHHLVGDMAELVKLLGETKATIVGHDWGAPVAWHAALWRPDLFPAVCAMSVPYAPPGYVDSEEGGFLTEAVRRRPYSVLLFDEVEKAHADVFNLMLQVLDDGRLIDGRGRTADFSNTVVIMTSNIGSKRILDTDLKMFESPEGREALGDVLRDELKNFLRPEFLNRIDDIVIFRPLSKVDLRGIVDIQLKRLEKLLVDRELKLDLTDAAKNALVDLGYEPAFGARPLKRAIL